VLIKGRDSSDKVVPVLVTATGEVVLSAAVTIDPTNLALEATQLLLKSAIVLTPGANQNVAVSAAHAESAAITGTRIRLASTTNCYIAFGAAPVADNTGFLLLAGHPEIFTFTSGQKVSALRVSADGTLSVTVV
jgi:hypothetical protein